MSEENELKPCPICQKHDTANCADGFTIAHLDENQFAVCCDVNRGGCGCTSGFRGTRAEAILAWNHRATPPGYETERTATRNVLETYCESLGIRKGMALWDLAYIVTDRLQHREKHGTEMVPEGTKEPRMSVHEAEMYADEFEMAIVDYLRSGTRKNSRRVCDIREKLIRALIKPTRNPKESPNAQG